MIPEYRIADRAQLATKSEKKTLELSKHLLLE